MNEERKGYVEFGWAWPTFKKKKKKEVKPQNSEGNGDDVKV